MRSNFKKCLLAIFTVLSLSIIVYVLFQYPQPGVADQGDFDRILSASGLELKAEDKNNPDFKRFFDYTVTDYKISKLNKSNIPQRIIVTSITHLINGINVICKLLGQDIFKTGYLAVAYSAIYLIALFMIIKYLNIESKATQVFLALLSLFVFFDGNYLLWFNSLYGEPMMITSLMLFAASWIYYIYHKEVLKRKEKIFSKIMFIFIASFVFLCSKLQVITALPFVIIMLIGLLWRNKSLLKRKEFITLCVLFAIIIAYPMGIKATSGGLSKDTQYNSVFYGVLKDSKDPRQDLIDMGLNPDMAVEAGKHSYLPEKDYVKYVPRTEITEKEFYSKMSNGKLVKFYITHPLRLIQGMEYTADHAFSTGTSLGKYKRSYSEEPVREFNRFTLWSDFRLKYLPKSFLFIVLVYIGVLSISLFIYIRNKHRGDITTKIKLLWCIMLIGIMQYPMPFMGNGHADTSKQLYLFNFIFDIILVVSICWLFDKLIKLVISKKAYR